MRHRVAGYKLKRDGSSRKALLRSLITSVIEQERVITTVPKAKAVKPLVDRMITLGKEDTLHRPPGSRAGSVHARLPSRSCSTRWPRALASAAAATPASSGWARAKATAPSRP